MQIVIPTYGRSSPLQQHTLRQLQAAGVEAHLVVQKREAHLYHWFKGPLIVLPDVVRTISATRDYLTSLPYDRIVSLDDDLHFAVRRDDAPDKFRQPTDNDIREMVFNLWGMADDYPMVGIGPREGGNRNTEEFLYNTRIMRVLAFNTKYLRDKQITFAPMELMEDFHVNLQILRSGRDTIVLNRWVSNQAAGSNAPGGCSSYRSEALQTAEAHKLAGLHPGFVRVVQKATKTAWGGGVRTDVTVQWKAARRSAEE